MKKQMILKIALTLCLMNASSLASDGGGSTGNGGGDERAINDRISRFIFGPDRDSVKNGIQPELKKFSTWLATYPHIPSELFLGSKGDEESQISIRAAVQKMLHPKGNPHHVGLLSNIDCTSFEEKSDLEADARKVSAMVNVEDFGKPCISIWFDQEKMIKDKSSNAAILGIFFHEMAHGVGIKDLQLTLQNWTTEAYGQFEKERAEQAHFIQDDLSITDRALLNSTQLRITQNLPFEREAFRMQTVDEILKEQFMSSVYRSGGILPEALQALSTKAQEDLNAGQKFKQKLKKSNVPIETPLYEIYFIDTDHDGLGETTTRHVAELTMKHISLERRLARTQASPLGVDYCILRIVELTLENPPTDLDALFFLKLPRDFSIPVTESKITRVGQIAYSFYGDDAALYRRMEETKERGINAFPISLLCFHSEFDREGELQPSDISKVTLEDIKKILGKSITWEGYEKAN